MANPTHPIPTTEQVRAWLKARGLRANVRAFNGVGSSNLRIVFPEMRDLREEEYREARDAKLPVLSELCREFGMFTVCREQDVPWSAFQCASIFLYWKLHGRRMGQLPMLSRKETTAERQQ